MEKLKLLNVRYFIFEGIYGSEFNSNYLELASTHHKTSPVTAQKLSDACKSFMNFREKHLRLLKKEGGTFLYELKSN
jgi:hypothetical protein